MPLALMLAIVVSTVSFLFYGLACLFTDHMVVEFERFGLSHMRRFTGALEIAGALGLIVGYAIPPVTLASSGGLALLMLLGAGVRVRVGDSFIETLPALIFLGLNVFIFVGALRSA
jgi:uncharacterized membrane protein